MLRIFANSLIMHTLYTRDFSFIFVMWDLVLFIICASDVAGRGASNRAIKMVADCHLRQGVRGAFLLVGGSFIKRVDLNR